MAFVATHFLVKRYKLSRSLYFYLQTLLVAVIQLVFNPASHDYAWQAVDMLKARPWTLGVVVAFFLLRSCIQLGYAFHQRYTHRNATKVHLYKPFDIQRVYNYMEQNEPFFDMAKKDIHRGVPGLLDLNDDKTNHTIEALREKRWIDDAQGILFKDTHFNVRGTVTFVQRDIILGSGDANNDNKNTEPQKCKAFYVTLNVKCSTLTAEQYFAKMQTWLDESATILTWSYKLMRKADNAICYSRMKMYNGPRSTYDLNRKQFFNSFFHNKKSMLMQRIRQMHPDKWHRFYDHGQTPTMNLLLHGPPGTGKSTFAYRLARLLNRNVVSIDLRSIDNKYELYCIIQEGRHISYYAAHKNVFVFEEFDIAVQYLHEKQKMRTKMLKAPLWSFESFRQRRGYAEEENKKNDDKNAKRESDRDARNTSFMHNEFHLKDLLELLQGPVPIEGQIVIATTNHYDKIKKLCPALFRPGRLSPIYFGMFNHASLQEFVQFYFGAKQIVPKRWPGTDFPLSPAKLIEIALYAKERKDCNKDAFAYFVKTADLLLAQKH